MTMLHQYSLRTYAFQKYQTMLYLTAWTNLVE